MILAALVALPLVTRAAFDPELPAPPANGVTSSEQLTPQQRDAVMRPLIRAATECVFHAVSADPRFPKDLKIGDVSELIVDSMTACANTMRAMIGAHDRLFGRGSGEAFFLGPYLDVLPAAVNTMVRRGD